MAMTVDEAKLALLNNSNLVEYILFNMPQDDRMQLISKYDTVCKSIVNKGVQLDSNITSNLPSMSILLNKLVVRAAINSITAAELNDKFPSLRDVLKTIRKSIETAKASGEKADSDYISLISFMKTKIGVNVADDVSVDSLKDAILQFSVSGEAITSSEEPDESEEENIPVDWDENDKETLSVSDESDSDIDIDSASTIEKIEKISKKNGGQITNAVRSLVDKLDFLYGDSFQAMPHVGIYTLNSQGSCSIIRVKGGKLSTLQDEYYSSDSSLMAAIVSMLNQFKSTSALPENKNEIFVPINCQMIVLVLC